MKPLWRYFTPLAARFREARMRRFAKDFAITDRTTIIDIGGSPWLWMLLRNITGVVPRVTIVNIESRPGFPIPSGMQWEQGDGCRLRHADASFDIAFSNSVIEHVGSFAAQTRFANEVRRVGRAYYVQTPNFFFPIEPHVYGLGIHWIYQTAQRWHYPLMRYASLAGLSGQVAAPRAAELAQEIHLLTAAQMRGLFPDAEFVREWPFLGAMSKSLICQRLPDTVRSSSSRYS